MSTLRTRRRLSLAVALAVALFVPGSLALAQEPEVVRITETLKPAQLEVAPGSTVTWRNDDDERHRIRSREGPEEFDSGNLEPGESFTFTFSLEGTYPYLDERDDDDPAYVGTIVVAGDGSVPAASGVPLASSAAEAPAALPASGAVSIIDRSFVPSVLEIATGGTITWSNDDGGDAHTVTSSGGAFDSGILEGGATFSQTFAEPGTYPYSCAIHPEMQGTITVADGAPAASPPASAAAAAAPSGEAPVSPASGAAPVTMLGREFNPGALEVAVGTTVDWLNDDGESHTVTALDGSFNSGVLATDDAFAVTFETPGTTDYICAIHPDMKGTITVTE